MSQKNETQQATYTPAIIVIVAGLALVALVLYAASRPFRYHKPPQMLCATNMKGIANSLLGYAQNHDGRLVDPNQWCDILLQQGDITPRTLTCPLNRQVRSTYALNSAAAPNLQGNPPDMVLMFESKPGWNLSGGPELLDAPHNKGCNILFGDMHAGYVRADELKSLRWTKDPNFPPR